MQRNPPKRKSNGPEPAKKCFPIKHNQRFISFTPKKITQKHPGHVPDISGPKTQKKPNNYQNIRQMLGSVFSNHPPVMLNSKKTWVDFPTFSGWSCGFVWWYFGLTFTIALPGKPNTKISCGEVVEQVDWWECFFLFMKLMKQELFGLLWLINQHPQNLAYTYLPRNRGFHSRPYEGKQDTLTEGVGWLAIIGSVAQGGSGKLVETVVRILNPQQTPWTSTKKTYVH